MQKIFIKICTKKARRLIGLFLLSMALESCQDAETLRGSTARFCFWLQRKHLRHRAFITGRGCLWNSIRRGRDMEAMSMPWHRSIDYILFRQRVPNQENQEDNGDSILLNGISVNNSQWEQSIPPKWLWSTKSFEEK